MPLVRTGSRDRVSRWRTRSRRTTGSRPAAWRSSTTPGTSASTENGLQHLPYLHGVARSGHILGPREGDAIERWGRTCRRRTCSTPAPSTPGRRDRPRRDVAQWASTGGFLPITTILRSTPSWRASATTCFSSGTSAAGALTPSSPTSSAPCSCRCRWGYSRAGTESCAVLPLLPPA